MKKRWSTDQRFDSHRTGAHRPVLGAVLGAWCSKLENPVLDATKM